ncbi:hypothetical protein AAVH_23036 [Aphelenchoides avenae]|nr:hypothetical protein AAVH_23036 [Aphelenchus avenae]
MDGTEYVIPGKHLIDRLHGPRTCSLNIMAFDLVDSDKYYNFVIGSPFLREYCQAYDAGNNQIGFSKNTDPNEMDTQKRCNRAMTLTGLPAMVVATLFAVVAF